MVGRYGLVIVCSACLEASYKGKKSVNLALETWKLLTVTIQYFLTCFGGV